MFENAGQFLKRMENVYGDQPAFRFVTEDGIRSVSYREYAVHHTYQEYIQRNKEN